LKVRSDSKTKSQHDNIAKQKSEFKDKKERKQKQIDLDAKDEDRFGLFTKKKSVKDGKERKRNKQTKK